MPVIKGVTLVGGAPVDGRDIDWATRHAPRLVAADAGAETILAQGLLPESVIGDMDSISSTQRARLSESVLHPVDEQDTTDFEKCLSRIDAPLVIALGVLGARLDHSMAALSVLARRGGPILLLGPEDVVMVLPVGRPVALDLVEGTRVSLFPLAEVTGRSTGLRWPIDGLTLWPLDRIGTSNLATGPVTLVAEGRGLLLLLPRVARDVALGAVRALSSSER